MKYGFAGESEQELRLTPGDIITDVKSLPSKPGWSEGTLRGEKGCFPDSMVELHVTECTMRKHTSFSVNQATGCTVVHVTSCWLRLKRCRAVKVCSA